MDVTIQRTPVPDGKERQFLMVMAMIATQYDVFRIPGVEHHFNAMCGEVERFVYEKEHPHINTKKENSARVHFAKIFRERYYQYVDREYPKALLPVDFKKIESLLERLEESHSTADEYLEWIFEDYLPRNSSLGVPFIGTVCGSLFLENYCLAHKDLIKDKKKSSAEQQATIDLFSRMRSAARKLNTPETIQSARDMITAFKNGNLLLPDFIKKIDAMEQQAKELEENG